MSKGAPFHRQLFEHLRDVSEGLPGGEAVEHGAEAVGRQVERGVEVLTDKVGGPARVRVVLLLAAVLGLSSADTGAVAAVAPKLEPALHIGNVDIGLLVTVASLTAALGMLPAGWVTDRWNRMLLLKVAVLCWAAAEVISAMSPNYTFLLIVRLALGALTAVTGPTLASLTGDLFPPNERSQIYGYILTGELLGAGFGLLVAGLVSDWLTWRWAFGVLALPSLLVAWELHKRLPEPARGGQSHLQRGDERIVPAEDVDEPPDGSARGAHDGSARGAHDGSAARGHGAPAPTATPAARDDPEVVQEVRRRKIDPREGTVLRRDPMDLGWWESFRYVVAVRSNVTIIVASALGYFFFSGVETFALIYIEGHYRVGQGIATLVALAVGGAAVVGAVGGGRITDELVHRGHITARLSVPAAAFVVALVVFPPGVIATSLAIAVPLFLVAGFCIAAPNPGLDAARLDIMPSRMWGRAEAVRSLLRSLLQSFAPLLFGLVSTAFGGRNEGFATSGMGTSAKHSSAAGLEPTFLLMLATLLAAAVIVWRGRHSYPVDVAAADVTERRFPAAASPGAAGTSDAGAAGGGGPGGAATGPAPAATPRADPAGVHHAGPGVENTGP